VLIGFFLLRRGELLEMDGKWEKHVFLFGDALFCDEFEEPCKVRHATMVGIVFARRKE
jgi:hypothetical protein